MSPALATTALGVLGLIFVAGAYVLFLRLAHSPAGSIKFIESSIALRKRLLAGEGGRIIAAVLGAGVLSAAIAGAFTDSLAAVLAALALVLPAAGIHRLAAAAATAAVGRIAHAESKTTGSGPKTALRAALIPATAALGLGTIYASFILSLAKSFVGSEAAGLVAATFALLYPVAAHLSTRTSAPPSLIANPARLSGLLSALAVTATSVTALLLLSPGCPIAGAPNILASGFAVALAVSGAFLFVAQRLFTSLSHAANS